MGDLVEKVARAMHAHPSTFDGVRYENEQPEYRALYEDKARAAIRVVVLALRDEVLQSPSLEDEGMVTVVDDIFDQILGDAGPQDDGILIGNQNVEAIINDLHDEQKSNAADPPQCEWTLVPKRHFNHDPRHTYDTGCGASFHYDYKQCQGCGKPIKFK